MVGMLGFLARFLALDQTAERGGAGRRKYSFAGLLDRKCSFTGLERQKIQCPLKPVSYSTVLHGKTHLDVWPNFWDPDFV